MATKDKIKKKKGNPPVAKASDKSEDQDDKSETGSVGKRTLIEVAEKPVNDEEGQKVEESPENVAEENKKDSGREKVRSETPSPPPFEEKSSNKTLDSVASPKYGKRRRSPVPFTQNKVEPIASGSKDMSNPGSLVSLQSAASVKEAWTDNEEDKKRPGSSSSRRSLLSNKVDKKSQSRKPSSTDVTSIRPTTAEQNAYIPYLYARNCIVQITDDMKAMKHNHIRIVHDIEAHYRSLEGESQTQFMAFVVQYREKFSGKMNTFRNTLEQFRQETQAKELKWNEEVASLNEKNTKLLQEKNEALFMSKEEVEKIDAEKVALAAQVTALAGGVGAAEYAKLQTENKELREEISKLQASPGSKESTVHVETEKAVPVLGAVPVPVGGRSSEEDDEARRQWTEQILRLQEDVTELKLENAKLAAINESLQQQVQQSSQLTERYAALENQYKALALVALEAPDSKMKEQLSKTSEDENMMKEEQQRLQSEISAWEAKFEKKNGREPTEDDKPDSVKELYIQHQEASTMVTSLEQQKETLTKLNSGVVPPAPESVTTGAEVAQPEVMTVEVKVPDPEVVTALEASQQEVSDLRSQLAELSALGGAAAVGAAASDDVVDKSEMDAANAALLQERAAHDNTKAELENVQKQLDTLNETLITEKAQVEAKMEEYKRILEAKVAAREEEISSLKQRKEELEEERLKDVPLDTAKEIKNLQNKISVLENEKSSVSVAQAGVQAQLSELTAKLRVSEEALDAQKAKQSQLEERLKVARKEKDEAVRDLTKLLSRKEPGRVTRQKSQVGEGPQGRGDVAGLKRENQELNAKIRQLEREAIVGGAAIVGGSASDKNVQKRHEKILKELEKRYDMERAKNSKLNENLKIKEDEASSLQKDLNKADVQVAKLSAELAALGIAAKEGVQAAGKVKALESENKKLLDENKTLTENFNSERVLRKKYYNMVEDMKGKIRVYCRARPLSSTESGRGNVSVLKSADEYTLSVASQRGLKEFQYDHVFMEDSSQESVFEDTNNLIQSAVDGYNVCIFAYGQTGSGKTFTMIGDSSKKFPGIAPRAFERIFELAEENKSKFSMSVTVYMMELYNDKLIDLFAKAGTSDDERMEIKKDKKGLVFVHGAIVKPASDAKELNTLFEQGSVNRHTASTKMNAESSRSHLILSIVLESTNKTTGTVMKGKLSLVDLAGSERVGKTGATAEQLKEAMSINKSLSALGDVISALSSEQSFIPYRNNKLTMLMQDSLGGNAKTLMFVNISPADYNVDETVISLTYASRVKLITNDASKNADNKEIARLKAVISKLKRGEAVAGEEEEEEA
ncbi:myosin-2 heavy chain [Aplysia californica]|uniref:Myosin-2 heavy chain n=1 Tax=Aplysia californica TaxID=6500 RepID=A0ABM0K8Q8_APLCA|nr:myosin-2 heavy chain [Aplysia californica]